jgi:acetolactate synthase-1/2/3 large subunit
MLAEGASSNLSLNIARSERNGTPRGALTGEALSAVLSQHLPEGGIVCDEGITLSGAFYAQTESSAPHEYLSVTGGAIGIGIPLSTGASVACPDSKVINFQADGSGLYTLQGLWTQARERLDVLTIILSNKAYAILFSEMRKIGIDQIGPNATRMLSLTDPAIDWVQLANGMGVEAVSVDSCEAFDAALRSALARRGPFLIECLL